MSARIRVLIVDDSALVRRALTENLSRCADIEVVGTAVDPYVARDKILLLNPDVLTLDIEMPRMDGLTFLKRLMQHRPMPVVILSSLTGTGSAKALEALQAGAVEVLEKSSGALSAMQDHVRLVEVIKAAARARMRPQPAESPTSRPPAAAPVRASVVRAAGARRYDPRKIILMGASTGGTEALRAILTRLRADLPGICIVQHIPALFSLAFAQRLNELCDLEVREARNGDLVQPGLALVAPGGFHIVLESRGCGYGVRLNEGPQVHYQRPAVDVLFGSAVKVGAAPHALSILLTGMGTDGASSLLELRNAGARTICQDEASSVVFGMPREAIRLGAAQTILSLDLITPFVERFASEVAIPGASAAFAGVGSLSFKGRDSGPA
jgi:two-component system, chemotaxis family, protein-glutamate methylesterase/glutaminase